MDPDLKEMKEDIRKLMSDVALIKEEVLKNKGSSSINWLEENKDETQEPLSQTKYEPKKDNLPKVKKAQKDPSIKPQKMVKSKYKF